MPDMNYMCFKNYKQNKCKSVVWCVFVLLAFVLSYSSTQNLNYCPRDFVSLGRKCYHFGRNAQTWLDAHYECVQKNSSLASITNPHQEIFVRNYVNKKFSADRQERWIGGRFNEKLKIWVWGESGEPLKFEAFAVKNSTKDLTWNCILLDPHNNNRWNSKNCMERKPYICQNNESTKVKRKVFDFRKCEYEHELAPYETKWCLKKGYIKHSPVEPAALVHTTIATPAVAHKLNYACAENMYMIGKKCYFFSKEPATWQEAFFACQGNETRLAIIRNKKHDLKIREFLTDQFVVEADRWIGGMYDHRKKKFRWHNGQALSYKGFARIGFRKKNLVFSTIFMDPKLQYRWSVDNMMAKKHYICQSNAKTIVILGNYKRRKKLKRPDATITILKNDLQTRMKNG